MVCNVKELYNKFSNRETIKFCKAMRKTLTKQEKESIKSAYTKLYKRQENLYRYNERKYLENRIQQLEEERKQILKILGVEDI